MAYYESDIRLFMHTVLGKHVLGYRSYLAKCKLTNIKDICMFHQVLLTFIIEALFYVRAIKMQLDNYCVPRVIVTLVTLRRKCR